MPPAVRQFFDHYIATPGGFGFMLGGLSCFLLLATGNFLIDWLKNRRGMKWAPREDTPDSHAQKAGTPSMGGIGIIGAASVGYLGVLVFFFLVDAFMSRGSSPGKLLLYLGIFPLLVILHAVLGYVDDHSKATNKGGLSSKAKLAGQVLLATLFLSVIYLLPTNSPSPIGMVLGNEVHSALFASIFTVVLALLIIIGTSNAVNLTDGIDGLAAGLSVQVGLAFLLFTFGDFYRQTGAIEISASFFWVALAGACLAFLAFNKYPARVFMGDTGSLALGAALGAGALLTRTVWLLPFIGFIFFVEMFSVIIQVLYFKITKRRTGEGKRVFRRAPLHHHFELGGWSERRVVWTFWLVNLVTSAVGLALWQAELLPRFL